MYVATPKVACSAFKWWIADLIGCRNEIQTRVVSLESDPDLIVHDTLHKIAPWATGLNQDGLEEALSHNDYFRFALVRNPYTRIFSAWQSKWLIRESLQISGYESADFFAYPVETVDDIRSSFEAFLEYLYAEEWPVLRDVHVTPQADLLEPELIDYRIIAHVEDPTVLLGLLSEHLGDAYRNPLATKSMNVGLLPYCGGFYSDRAMELVNEMYARDFELFGYPPEVPAGSRLPDDEAMGLAARAIKLLRGRNERIGVLGRHIKSAASTGETSPLEVQLFYIEDKGKNTLGHFVETSSVRAYYPNEGKPIRVDLSLPEVAGPISRLRVDIANAPVAINLHGMSLATIEGDCIWQWNGDCGLLVKRIGVVCVPQTEGSTLLCLHNDPQFELNIPPELLTQVRGGAVLQIAATPKPLLEQLPDILAGLQARTAAVAAVGGATPTMTTGLGEIAELLQALLATKNSTIAAQHEQIMALQQIYQQVYENLIRAEAQLDFMKDLVKIAPDDDCL